MFCQECFKAPSLGKPPAPKGSNHVAPYSYCMGKPLVTRLGLQLAPDRVDALRDLLWVG